MSRPEHQGPPEIVYNETEASKYTSNTRIASIQAEMADRALELLALPDETCFLLDIGCGSGLSGEILEEAGHLWVGFDISPHMLDVAVERNVEGDLFLQDAGEGLSFRPGTFDGAISISVIQWLCNADKAYHYPVPRLNKFFTTLFMCLKNGARAVFQFYPESDDQLQLILTASMKAGFTGGLVVDYPNSKKARKHYLCLFAGQSTNQNLPKPLESEGGETVRYDKSKVKESRRRKTKEKIKGKEWVVRKKEQARARGEIVKSDSKYTARKRKPRF